MSKHRASLAFDIWRQLTPMERKVADIVQRIEGYRRRWRRGDGVSYYDIEYVLHGVHNLTAPWCWEISDDKNFEIASVVDSLIKKGILNEVGFGAYRINRNMRKGEARGRAAA